MGTFGIFLVLLVLLLLKGFFSGSEIALVNADKIKLHHRANLGHKGAGRVLRLFRTPEVLLGTTLVGTSIATVTFTTIATTQMIRLLGDAGDFYAFLALTPVLLIFGEIVPKSVYQQKSDAIAPIVIYPLQAFSFLFYPVIYIFGRVARIGAWFAGGGKHKQHLFITREQVRMVVEMAERSTNVDNFDRARIKRAIRFAETTVGEAMIPVADITAINRNSSTQKAVGLVRKRGYNRLPVYERNVSNIIGMVLLTTWDLMEPDVAEQPLSTLIRPVHYVSAYQTIDELLPVLREREDRMAVVVDEFGSAIGLITMEDILEEVVGEIDVGYDFEEYLPRRQRAYEKLGEETYLMDSRLALSEVNELLGIQLPTLESHTIGGLVISHLRHLPAEDESIVAAGYRFTVAQATERGIAKVRVEPEWAPGE